MSTPSDLRFVARPQCRTQTETVVPFGNHDTVEMPDRMAENLIRFIRVNEGKLGRKWREGEFEKLTDNEVASIEAIVCEAFDGFES